MRIPCPFCGERDAGEFECRGDAAAKRPTSDTGFHAYVYLRDNPAGPIEELWYHTLGCRTWLVVSRDTLTHEVGVVRLASGASQ